MKPLFMPLVTLMNSVPFALKILLSVSVLFTLLIAPSYSGVQHFLQTREHYHQQLTGLAYTERFHKIIENVQLHRGLLNGYLNGNSSFKDEILKSEKSLNNALLELIAFDRKSLHHLQSDKNFIDALSMLEIVKFHEATKANDNSKLFQKHNHIVLSLIRSLRKITQLTSFDVSENKSIDYIAHMLEEKLLLLQEYTGQIRGLATGILAGGTVTKARKEQLLTLYTLINTLKEILIENSALNHLDTYLSIQKQTKLVEYSTDQLLSVVNRNILLGNQKSSYDSRKFFKDATAAINVQSKLYDLLSQNYSTLIEKMERKLLIHYAWLLLGFLLIVLSSVYIFGALYYSVTENLRKLRFATKRIAKGRTDIRLRVDSRDEIGEALQAFNNMSEKLGENISFLNGYKMAIDTTSIVTKTNPQGIITYVNRLFCEISGYSEKELLGFPHNIVRHPDMPKEVFANMWHTIKSGKVWKGIVKNRKKDGASYIVDATIIPIFDANGEIYEYVGVRHDITELEKSKEELRKQRVDMLTGLANRNQLIEDLKQIERPVLFYLNIDTFGALNDFYGEKAGDKVLIDLANAFKEIADKTKARLYKTESDGFVLVYTAGDINEKNYQQLLSTIIEHIESNPVRYNLNNFIYITLSGSVVCYHPDHDTSQILTYASIARKVARKENKKFLRYAKDMHKEKDYAHNITWIKKIKEALEHDRIVPFFQPIIDTRTGTITKYESLVRLIDDEGKTVSPFFFLDIAKKARLYAQITRIVIDKSFARSKEMPRYEFSINITAEDIYDIPTARYILEKLKTHPHPGKIIFEITESEEIEDYQRVNDFIARLRNYGARIAIDDFGSGYASFEHILSLKPDFIKIDGSLIKNIDTDEESRIITEAIIAFSKKLGSKTVVEFVHNESVYRKIIELHADFAQGFHLGEPQKEPAVEILENAD